MKVSAENMNMLWASLMVEELIRNKIDFFCISPGSRSAPLTIAVARHPGAKSQICYDERGAAFHALGYARATGKAAVLICTSGTAVANYLAAVVEASQDQIPLFMLSADRPPELQKTGANQSIPQDHIFADFVHWQFTLPCPDEKINPRSVLTTIDQAISRSMDSFAGPVHLNCQFREPLAPSTEPIPEGYLKNLEEWQTKDEPFTKYFFSKPVVSVPDAVLIQDLIKGSSRGVIVAGRLKSDDDGEAVTRISKYSGWLVIADIASGIPKKGGVRLLAPIEILLRSRDFKNLFQPDLILHFGKPLTSKRFLQYLETTPPQYYIHVSEFPDRLDPAHAVTHRVMADISCFCEKMENSFGSTAEHEWCKNLIKYSESATGALKSFFDRQTGLSEFLIVYLISQEIEEGSGLFLASSLPIREMDMFGRRKREVPVAANRGASGIDGTIASASGFAAGLGKPVTLLIGDLAFFHDLNSLYLLKSLEVPVVVILLNNQGGGIFSLLPIAQFEDVFEKYFATPHDLTFSKAADLFNLDYQAPTTKVAFLDCYRSALRKKTSTIIEIETSRQENVEIMRQIEEMVKSI